MIEFIKIVILAIVQGIAEFLPISSSGHLALISAILDSVSNIELDDSLDSLTISVILHLGTLLSILVYYWKTLLNIILKLRFKLAFLLILASIPAAVAGVLLHDFFEETLDNLFVIGAMFLLTAFLLLTSQWVSRRKINDADPKEAEIQSSGKFTEATESTDAIVDELSSVTWVQALVIGIFQMFAILPGLSRSGSTIAGGLFTGLKQSVAANFSFLMAIPVIGGAGLLELIKLIKHKSQAIPVSELTIGFLLSFLVGLFALYWVINWIKKGKLAWFAYWLFIMAGVAFSMALFCK